MSARRADGERVGVIPLASPTGAVYAYACSTCHHVGGGSELLYTPDEPGPIAPLVESSLRDAESCCVCRTCSGPAPRGVRHGLECTSCSHWSAFVRFWWDVAEQTIELFGLVCTLALASQDEDVAILLDVIERIEAFMGRVCPAVRGEVN